MSRRRRSGVPWWRKLRLILAALSTFGWLGCAQAPTVSDLTKYSAQVDELASLAALTVQKIQADQAKGVPEGVSYRGGDVIVYFVLPNALRYAEPLAGWFSFQGSEVVVLGNLPALRK